MKIAFIGFGARGNLYCDILRKKGVEISAICDISNEKLEYAKNKYGFNDDIMFNNINVFFKEKRANLLVISTLDNTHYELAIKALHCGYDILLEKPIASTFDQCKEIEETAIMLNKKIFVCHVLRYADFFNKIKEELDNNNYGEIIDINLTENVGFWHFAHSYVRGNWRKEEETTPMILAKCCHDLDLISWYIDSKCKRVTSFGRLSYFKLENSPEDSGERCLSCKYHLSCAYSAEKIYIKDFAEKGKLEWPNNVVVENPTIERLYDSLQTSPYGRCVFKCDNNVVDHQMVNMEFENGATAHLTMTGFSSDCFRDIHIHCVNGDIYGNMKENILHCNIFGTNEKMYDISIINENSYGHGGGDVKLIDDILNFLKTGKSKSLTTINNSMQSHYIGFNAEISRKNGGKIIDM